MDNKLRETAVTVAVWASSQHAIAEVWFSGPRLMVGEAPENALDVIVVMADHAQQVEARKAGRQVSAMTWEDDISRAVRGPHNVKNINAGANVGDTHAVRIFSRRAETAPGIVCPPQRSEPSQTSSTFIGSDIRGEIGNVRSL